MEKLPAPQKKTVSPQEWESLIEDFHPGTSNLKNQWSSMVLPLSLLDIFLSSLTKKGFPISLKLHLVFLDEFADALFGKLNEDSSEQLEQVLSRFFKTLEIVIQSPIDGVSIAYALKEQMLVSVTSIFMTLIVFLGLGFTVYGVQFEGLVAIILTIINRPNHGVDRQTRAVACECLRVLEREYLCLLAEVVGHLWGLCQNERTHGFQCYLLLLLEVIHHIVACKLNVSSNWCSFGSV